MGGSCSQCKHFRRVRPISQILANAIGTSEGAVANALAKIVDDEQKLRDSEAEYKRTKASTEHMSWATRPVMSAFCGQREDEELYLIAEVKNAGLKCEDFRPGRPQPRACTDCVYR